MDSASISVAANILGKFITSGVAEKLTTRVSNARKEYEKSALDFNHPIEHLRKNALKRICNLQQDVVFYVSDADFLAKVLPLTLEYTGSIYEAKTMQDLEILDMNISRIENALAAYQKDRSKRKQVRWIAVFVSFMSILGTGVFLWFSEKLGFDSATFINIINLPLPVLLWSIIGSYAAILYRFTNAGDSELKEPLRWLFARPLTGIIMGAISFLIMQVGLFSINADDAAKSLGGKEIVWLVAFLAGFSDRFSDYLLKNVVGRFGGNTDGDLITLEMTNKVSSTQSSKFPFLNFLTSRSYENQPVTNGGNQPKENLVASDTFSVENTPDLPEIEKEIESVNETKVKLVTGNKEKTA